MRGRQLLQRSSLYIALGLFGLSGAFTMLTGCGGGPSGSTGGQTTTTVTSVTVSPATATVTVGNNATFAATVAGTNNPSQVVTWSVSPATAGTITSAGVFTPSTSITETTTATVIAASTVPGYTTIVGMANVTINPATVTVTVSSVSIALNPSSGTITTSQTLTCTGTVTYSNGTTDNNVTYSATDGTISSSGVFTPAAAGAATCKATSVKDSTKSATANITVTAVVVTVSSVSIAISPSNGAINMSQTATCTGTVTYSNGTTDSNVNYTATDGTITSSGVFTPTATGAATCTATSVKDSTKSATANITVSVAPIVLSSISPNEYYAPNALSSPPLTAYGSGLPNGGLCNLSGYANPGTIGGSNSTEFPFSLSAQMRPRFVDMSCTQANGSGQSNTLPIATIGTVLIAGGCSDYIFADSQGPGTIRQFNRAAGTYTDLSTSTYNGGIAVVCNPNGTTYAVVVNNVNGMGWSTPNGSAGGGVGNGNSMTGIAANGLVMCSIEQSIHELACAAMVNGSSGSDSIKFSPAIGTPEALTMSSASGTNTVYVIDGQGDGTNPVLYSFSVGTDGTLTNEKSLPLPGFTPASKFTQAQLNSFVNWQVVASQTSNTVAISGPVLNASTGAISLALAVVNGSAMTETTPSVVPLPSGSFMISEDDVHSATLVQVADVTSGAAGVNRIWSRPNTAAGALTQLASTSSILNMGPILSADGSTIYVVGWDPANDSAGLQLQSVPNK